MVAMHLLQCVHSRAHRVPGASSLMRLIRSGSASSGTAHRDEVEALGHREVHGLAIGDAAQQDQRHRQCGAELLGLIQEIGLAVGILAQELLAAHPDAPAQRRLEGVRELLDGSVPAEQVQRVEQGTACRELEGVEAAVGFEPRRRLQRFLDGDAAAHPVGHVELGRHGDAIADGLADGPHQAAGHLGTVLQGAAELVGATVDQRAEERAGQIVVTEVDLDGVEAGFDG